MVNVLSCEGGRTSEEVFGRAVEVIRSGGLVAFPTETVYGLGANATSTEAVRRIFEAKERPLGHPLIVHLDDPDRAEELAETWPQMAERLAAQFWPGPLTIIVDKAPGLPDTVTGGLPTVGLRLPDHPVARGLVEASDCPIAAPSANLHTRLSPTRAEHVVSSLGDRVDLVLDDGRTEVGIESTVVSLAESTPSILRPGMIGRSEIEQIVGEVELRDSSVSDGSRPSPGMDPNHYTPSAALRLADRNLLRDRLANAGTGVGVVWRGEPPEFDRIDAGPNEVLPDRPADYAKNLYDALHRLDSSGCTEIWVEEPPKSSNWRPVLDRLERAAAR